MMFHSKIIPWRGSDLMGGRGPTWSLIGNLHIKTTKESGPFRDVHTGSPSPTSPIKGLFTLSDWDRDYDIARNG